MHPHFFICIATPILRGCDCQCQWRTAQHRLLVLQVTHLQDDEVVLIVGKEHALASAGQVSKDQLADIKFVALHRSSTVQAIHKSLEEHGVDWRSLPVVMLIPDIPSCKSAAPWSTCPGSAVTGFPM